MTVILPLNTASPPPTKDNALMEAAQKLEATFFDDENVTLVKKHHFCFAVANVPNVDFLSTMTIAYPALEYGCFLISYFAESTRLGDGCE